MTRGGIKSAVERNLDKNTVVILDSMNYIKGFRYEIDCIAKAQQTTKCLLFCHTELDKCVEMNIANENKFDETTFYSLLFFWIYFPHSFLQAEISCE